MGTIITILTYASFVIAGAVVALTAIAPLTKTSADDKALTFLTWLHDTIAKIILPIHDVSPKSSDKA